MQIAATSSWNNINTDMIIFRDNENNWHSSMNCCYWKLEIRANMRKIIHFDNDFRQSNWLLLLFPRSKRLRVYSANSFYGCVNNIFGPFSFILMLNYDCIYDRFQLLMIFFLLYFSLNPRMDLFMHAGAWCTLCIAQMTYVICIMQGGKY